MATDVEQPLKTLERINSYAEFIRSEGIPVIRGFAIQDLKTLELGEWARKGGRGAYVNLEGTGGTNDAYVCEIPPGGSLNPERHLFEEMIYVVDGSGSTSVWYDETNKRSFEWQTGSLFAIPLNARFQYFNGSGPAASPFPGGHQRAGGHQPFPQPPLRLRLGLRFRRSVRRAGAVLRRQGRDLPGQLGPTKHPGDELRTEYPQPRAVRVAGTRCRRPQRDDRAGPQYHGRAHLRVPGWHLQEGAPPRPGAHVIILSGKGYSLLWPQGADPKRADWQPGSVVVPPNQWFHQHFNAGAEPARYLALRWGSQRYDMGAAFSSDESDIGRSGADVSVKEGGWQIEYEDEDRGIHEMFEAELARAGALCRMKAEIPWCTPG